MVHGARQPGRRPVRMDRDGAGRWQRRSSPCRPGAGQPSYLNQPIEVPDLRPELKRALGVEAVAPAFCLRVVRAELPSPPPRRPVDEVLIP